MRVGIHIFAICFSRLGAAVESQPVGAFGRFPFGILRVQYIILNDATIFYSIDCRDDKTWVLMLVGAIRVVIGDEGRRIPFCPKGAAIPPVSGPGQLRRLWVVQILSLVLAPFPGGGQGWVRKKVWGPKISDENRPPLP